MSSPFIGRRDYRDNNIILYLCDCARGFAAGHIRGCAVLVSDRLRKALDLVRPRGRV